MSAQPLRLYTAEEVRRLDAAAVAALGISSQDLMERAGTAAFGAIREAFPGARCWSVLCGAGNNAGDGYVVARLARAAGLQVGVHSLVPVERLRGEAARAAQDWLAAGGEVRAGGIPATGSPDVAVDALLGSGLDRPVTGDWARAVADFNALACPRVALDLPSGLCADTGAVLGEAVRAAFTVCFVGRKRGLYTHQGPDHAGSIVFDDLGLPADAAATVGGQGSLLDAAALREGLPPRPRNAHKGDFGHVLVVGGAAGMGGAARLAGEGALRGGAGLTSIATHPAHAHWLNLTRPELMCHAVASAADLQVPLRRATVLAIGPGLGQDGWARGLLDAALQSGLPAVLDADALNLLPGNGRTGGDRVLTPHPGEAGRLLGVPTAEVQADRFGAALAIARRYAAVTVLKGRGTVVASPQGAWAVCALGNPGMATGGSGDVLCGLVAALRAQGLDAWRAACLGVTAHAAAGDLAARAGERGLAASDLADALRLVLNG